MAQVSDGFRRTLRRQYIILAGRRLPDMRHRQKAGRQRVSSLQRPVSVQVFGLCETGIAEIVKCLLHRVKRVTVACQDAELHYFVELLWQCLSSRLLDIKNRPTHGQFADRHAIDGECAGLVYAEDRGRAEGFDHRHSASQDVHLRQSPRTQGEEDGPVSALQ